MNAKQRNSLGAAVALLTAVISACDVTIKLPDMNRIDGSGTIATETVAAAGFDTVALLSEGDVTITIGDESSVTITGDDNLLPILDATVSNGTLRLELTEDNTDIEPSQAIEWRIVVPSLTAVQLTGAGNMSVASLVATSFDVTLTGAGSISVADLDASMVSVSIPGAGSVTLAGEADQQDVSIPGAGDYEGMDLRTRDADVTVSGAGSATVMVTERLDATVTGVGSILYAGNPEVIETVTGVGSVRPVGYRAR